MEIVVESGNCLELKLAVRTASNESIARNNSKENYINRSMAARARARWCRSFTLSLWISRILAKALRDISISCARAELGRKLVNGSFESSAQRSHRRVVESSSLSIQLERQHRKHWEKEKRQLTIFSYDADETKNVDWITLNLLESSSSAVRAPFYRESNTKNAEWNIYISNSPHRSRHCCVGCCRFAARQHLIPTLFLPRSNQCVWDQIINSC